MSRPLSPPNRRPKVLLVDRDADLRAALTFSLELDGYQVEALASGEGLLARTLPGRNACLVIDDKLGDVSGLETLGILRRRGVGLPAVLVTNRAHPALLARAGELDARVVEKPLLGDALTLQIQSLLPSHAGGGPGAAGRRRVRRST